MIINKIFADDIKEEYFELYKEVFKENDLYQSPAFVYVGYEDNKVVGFMSGYNHNAYTVYIQYAGATEQFRGYKVLNFFKEAIEFIHREYEFIMIWIRNDNIPALKIALSNNFRIIGTRMATDRNLYIELLRRR
ncbi:MAG: hypothetical protein EHM79_00410 [Geobacter sp.]|nr:MAG: hypothetical protein EHM79_00410 [Geobacter sp.]